MIENTYYRQRSVHTCSFVLAGVVYLLFLVTACGTSSFPASSTSTIPFTPTHATPLTLHFACNDAPKGGFYVLAAGTHGRICVQTVPGAALTITVKFCNDILDQSQALKGTVYANGVGYYEWNWKPQAPCAPHIWKGIADVQVAHGGQRLTFSSAFVGD